MGERVFKVLNWELNDEDGSKSVGRKFKLVGNLVGDFMLTFTCRISIPK